MAGVPSEAGQVVHVLDVFGEESRGIWSLFLGVRNKRPAHARAATECNVSALAPVPPTVTFNRNSTSELRRESRIGQVAGSVIGNGDVDDAHPGHAGGASIGVVMWRTRINS